MEEEPSLSLVHEKHLFDAEEKPGELAEFGKFATKYSNIKPTSATGRHDSGIGTSFSKW